MKAYYYVYRVGGFAPKYKHETLASAQAEAEKLAAKHPGESFEILKCVGISSAPAPKASTFFVDGEPAAPPKSFDNASTVPPVVGKRFWMRNGDVVKVVRAKAKVDSKSAQYQIAEYEAVNDIGLHYYYNNKGKNEANAFFDLVQQCPF